MNMVSYDMQHQVEPTTPLDALRRYVSEQFARGRVTFDHDVAYFRGAWLDPEVKAALEADGTISRVGTRTVLELQGITILSDDDNDLRVLGVFYAVDVATLA